MIFRNLETNVRYKNYLATFEKNPTADVTNGNKISKKVRNEEQVCFLSLAAENSFF